MSINKTLNYRDQQWRSYIMLVYITTTANKKCFMDRDTFGYGSCTPISYRCGQCKVVLKWSKSGCKSAFNCNVLKKCKDGCNYSMYTTKTKHQQWHTY